jgi:hypothetical protein
MGRPMRISLQDCDVPMASIEDIMSDLIDLPEAAWNKFVPPNLNILAEYWVHFLGVTETLGQILSMSYTPHGVRPTISQVQEFEKKIRECSPPVGNEDGARGQLLAIYANHFQLYQQ